MSEDFTTEDWAKAVEQVQTQQVAIQNMVHQAAQYRDAALSQGFSDAAAEQLAIHFHGLLMEKVLIEERSKQQ